MKESSTKRVQIAVATAAVALLSCAAVSRGQSASPLSSESPLYREVTDETGRTVRVPQPVNRIVSLAPSLTETVYALGLQDHLVGDTVYCDYPPDAQKKTKVGDTINPSLEQIAVLHPDLVLVTSINRFETENALETLGIPTYGTDPHTVNEIMSSSRKLADVLGAPAAGVSVTEEMQRRLDDLQHHLGAVSPKRVLFVVWHQPLISVGKHTFIADALRLAGAVSIVDSEQDWPHMSLEEVARLQPDYLVFSPSHSDSAGLTVDTLATLPGWNIVDAVTNRRFAVISDAVNRPAPRIVSAIEDLARQLHPDAFVEKPEKLDDKNTKDKIEKEKGKDEKAVPAPVPPPPSSLSLLSSAQQYNAAILGGCACVH
ncbi:MAG TPA: cobalamin-binding protein [Candidatus Acidoferrum sp.]|nr:cobalamin-binding protein [Candidatus Acidoferrum sp.]